MLGCLREWDLSRVMTRKDNNDKEKGKWLSVVV